MCFLSLSFSNHAFQINHLKSIFFLIVGDTSWEDCYWFSKSMFPGGEHRKEIYSMDEDEAVNFSVLLAPKP